MKLFNLIKNNAACGIPWISADIDLGKKTIKPCCKYGEDYQITTSIDEHWYGEKFNTLRNDWSENRHHAMCYKCDVPAETFSYKKFKYPSMLATSQQMNLDLATDSIPKPRILKITTGNICNLACRMCSPSSSTKMTELIKKSPWLSTMYNTNTTSRLSDLSWLDGVFENAQIITLLGGEPFYDPIIKDILYRIKKESIHKQITIATSTNMMFSTPKFLELIKELDFKFTFNVSIDGPEMINNYVRHLSDLSTIIDNSVNLLSQFPNRMNMNVNVTINALNVGYPYETVEVINSWNSRLQKELGKKINYVMSSPVYEPDCMQPGVLPQSVKDFYLKKFESQHADIRISGSAEYIDTCKHLLKEDCSQHTDTFKKYIDEYDAVANTDYKKVYPEFNWS